MGILNRYSTFASQMRQVSGSGYGGQQLHDFLGIVVLLRPFRTSLRSETAHLVVREGKDEKRRIQKVCGAQCQGSGLSAGVSAGASQCLGAGGETEPLFKCP